MGSGVGIELLAVRWLAGGGAAGLGVEAGLAAFCVAGAWLGAAADGWLGAPGWFGDAAA